MKSYLNLGCGKRFSVKPCWKNIDYYSIDPHVQAHNLLDGIPFGDFTFDAVYHSNVLEHFTRIDGKDFLTECFRVLKPGGVLRVVVPDMEDICREYFTAIKKASDGEPTWQKRYEWIVLEMLDQMVRIKSGGEMMEYLKHDDLEEGEYIIARIGSVGREIIQSKTQNNENAIKRKKANNTKIYLLNAIKIVRKTLILYLLSKQEKNALQIGLFRASGEVHQWMYDRYSLSELLRNTCFVDIEICTSTTSRISEWNSYQLDVDSDGLEHTPAALYVEAVRPE